MRLENQLPKMPNSSSTIIKIHAKKKYNFDLIRNKKLSERDCRLRKKGIINNFAVSYL